MGNKQSIPKRAHSNGTIPLGTKVSFIYLFQYPLNCKFKKTRETLVAPQLTCKHSEGRGEIALASPSPS